jgi:hypothetical protein
MSSHYLRTRSTLDNRPILVALSDTSKNRKTGQMVQSWILRDRVSPIQAVKSGGDSSVCGDCPRRWYLGGDCYVVPGRGPLNIWRSIKGHYGENSSARPLDLVSPPRSLVGRPLRLGAYGDPALVPFPLWERIMLALKVERWTGYTHQWRTCDPRFQNLVMASCDSENDRLEAHEAGWRTFRVRSVSEPVLPGEFMCPASNEAGKVRTCETCFACTGGNVARVSPVIVAHGPRNQKGLVGLRTS